MPGKRILIADDDPLILDPLVEKLRQAGFEVVAFHSGEDAIVRGGMCSPDLILLDIVMQDVDGYTVARRLRAHPTLENTPIIFFTAQELDHPAISKRLEEIGHCAFVNKNRPFEELLATIQERMV